MSLSSALSIANGSLANINFGLDLLSQNIANASTPQYLLEIATQQSLAVGGQEFGVRSGVALRATDTALQAQLAEQQGQASFWQTTSNALATIQPALGTVGGGTDLGSQLGAVQSAFSALLNDPADASQQANVVAAASSLTDGINTLSQSYAAARQTAENGVVSDVGQLNTALGTIGDLSLQIISLRSQGLSTADLENQRDQAENTVSGLIGAQFQDQPNGDVQVLTQTGVQLPTHTPNPLGIQAATTGPTTFYPGGGVAGISLGGVDITQQLTGGSLGANVALRDQTIPTYQASLDQFSQSLSSRFADQGLTLFTNAAGVIPSTVGRIAQSGYVGYASTIQVNPAVIANPALVRDGTDTIAGSATGASAFTPNSTGLPGFTTLINRVLTYALGSDVQDGVPQTPIPSSGLGPTGHLNTGFAPQQDLADYANALTASQSADAADASDESTTAQGVQTSLQGQLTGKTGVSLDTELGLMVQLQNAYGASAKVISTVQDLFNTTLNMVQ